MRSGQSAQLTNEAKPHQVILGKACTLGQAFVNGWCADRDAVLADCLEELRIARALYDTDSDVHRILAAAILAADGDHDRALHHQERALALNPNDDLIVVQQGEILTWIGRREEGVEWIRKAMRLNPYHPERFWNHLGRAYFVARRYGEAVEAFGHITRLDHSHLAFVAACRAAMGDVLAAQSLARAVLVQAPGFFVGEYMSTQHYKRLEDREQHRTALLGRLAGVNVTTWDRTGRNVMITPAKRQPKPFSFASCGELI